MRTERIMRASRIAITLAASLAASLVASRPAAAAESCAASRLDVSSWPIVRSPRVPGLSLRLPRNFERDGRQQGVASPAPSERWTDPARGRLLISWGAPAGLASPGGGPEHSRCEERVGSAVAVIVSYARRKPSGGSAAGPLTAGAPFRLQARLRWPDGEEAVVLGDAADLERFGELLAAVRTIRRVGA
jgi:hypothetical protein